MTFNHRKRYCALLLGLLSLAVSSLAGADGETLRVRIAPEIDSIEVMHEGHPVTIGRIQDPANRINPVYAKTSRDCPPFCIQPVALAPGVETIGELELLEYLVEQSKSDSNVIVIDSRTPDWIKKGTIAGARNIPWTTLSPAAGAAPFSIADRLKDDFGAIQ